ncbi:class II glutamine amidotransferase [Legionella jamestowniensis]|uniref:Glutamine amidotransferase n=1 Tax=Legionella jamestowniensis TaxID=455 RepID=A0A0W0UI29_9GAMM|nr:class II glutamine amidotransferase [Legionella jamestowniensis]KTD07550.1 glutamine amidotransferase [Legionella jamestowniensis]OCH97681.1 class II glutamine amidotransferase [Legionella jamestowniensis]SFM01637.1 glutamine amidotransferase [Legionella jamestowniensis DSM 19215]
MCRFVAYLGHEALLDDILVKPANSIVMQSLHARETVVPTNGDGFGLGWYTPLISEEPALFTSISPAWNDRNLLHLTAKIKSPCFFAHVRAAGAGGVTNYNCHPFIHGRWMLMHNGDIADFIVVKRHLRHLLDDDIYHWIQGETDSEHLFALFLQLAKGKDLSQLAVVADVLEETFAQINELIKYFGTSEASYFNVCLTDGERLVASRYTTHKKAKPESLHYFVGGCFTTFDHTTTVKHPQHTYQCCLIASERLTNFNTDWQDVPANHLLLVDKTHEVQLRSLALNAL